MKNSVITLLHNVEMKTAKIDIKALTDYLNKDQCVMLFIHFKKCPMLFYANIIVYFVFIKL